MKKSPSRLKIVLLITVIILLSLTLANNLIIGNSTNILSFALSNTMAYLFFLFLPAELFFIYYLKFHNPLFLLFVAIITALIAQSSDYIFGYLSSNNIKSLIKPKKYKKYRAFFLKYGYYAIFFFNLSPLSSPVMSLIAGFMKLRLRKVLFISFLGLLIKYILIIFFYQLIF